MPPKSGKRARKIPTIRQSTIQRATPDNTEHQGASRDPSSSSWITKVKTTKNTSVRLNYKDTILSHHYDETISSSSTPVEHVSDNSKVDAINLHTSDMTEVPENPSCGDTSKAKLKRKREYTVKSKLVQWIELRDATLDEILCHNGPGPFKKTHCNICSASVDKLFRCKDCGHGTALLCQACLLSNHTELPLHRIELWKGKFFIKTSLSHLGLHVQLGHDGQECPCPIPGPKDFVVFHTSGAHTVNIDYCDCALGQPPIERYIQLLRMQWFPATHVRPHMAFTFECMDNFHESTLQGKGNLYDYYNTLLRRTDNANIGKPLYRFPEIHRVFRLWRNLMGWKRAGRGQEPSGNDGAPAGSLTVECPACPHPGRNLPDNWQNAGPLLFLYTLFIAVDANFKLKGKDRKLGDIDLIPGTGIFVEDQTYQAHLQEYKEQPEINTCNSEHDAIVRASIRSTPGYAVSGVGLVVCSRHSLVRPNGVGDLQKGERYCNMDFIVLSSLMGITLLCVLITYDIACQWSKNLQKRMLEFPEHMRIPSSTRIQMAIPSWHINGHGTSCRENFCLGYMKGVGRTCGEEVETTWSNTNPLAGSTREMALAARHDALNDHWNGWNFRKTVGFGPAFVRKFKDAAKLQKKHKKAFDDLTSTVTPTLIQQWTMMIEKWEVDPSQPNPYKEPTNTVTLQDVRLELAKEEANTVAAGNIIPHKITMTGFLVTGLELEDQQYKLRAEFSNKAKSKTTKKEADTQDKRTGLLRRIQNWRQAQLIYTPHVVSLIATNPSVDDNQIPNVETAENTPLFLPSALPPHIRSISDMKRICEMEISLRKAAADDALLDIQRGRRNITKLWKHKKLNTSGMGNRPNTCMLTVYNWMNFKIERAAHKYRRARSALVSLDPQGQWETKMRELKREDMRGPGKDPDDLKTSNGRYEESWIWSVQQNEGVAADEEKEFNNDMRVEWAKSRAKVKRWKEECLLVQEEMRRVLEWFEWKAGWWEEHATIRWSGSPKILKGVEAYAHKQAYILRLRADRCALEWLPLLRKHGIEPGWADRPIHADTVIFFRNPKPSKSQDVDLVDKDEVDIDFDYESSDSSEEDGDEEEKTDDEDDHDLVFDD